MTHCKSVLHHNAQLFPRALQIRLLLICCLSRVGHLPFKHFKGPLQFSVSCSCGRTSVMSAPGPSLLRVCLHLVLKCGFCVGGQRDTSRFTLVSYNYPPNVTRRQLFVRFLARFLPSPTSPAGQVFTIATAFRTRVCMYQSGTVAPNRKQEKPPASSARLHFFMFLAVQRVSALA